MTLTLMEILVVFLAGMNFAYSIDMFFKKERLATVWFMFVFIICLVGGLGRHINVSVKHEVQNTIKYSDTKAFANVFRSTANRIEVYRSVFGNDILVSKLTSDLHQDCKMVYEKSENKIYWKVLFSQIGDIIYNETKNFYETIHKDLTEDNWRGILHMMADYIERRT